MARLLIVALLGLVLPLGAAALGAELDGALGNEPSDYRMEHYRAPVPGTLQGATVVTTEEAHALWTKGGVAFVDVMPQAPKPAGLPKGTIWRERPRRSIPGAIWLPNVGYGALHDTMDAYFRTGMETATGDELTQPVLFFCLADCWMSWNAAKRALEYGYTQVYWYPEGTDGWGFDDFPLEKVQRFGADLPGAEDG